MMLLNLGYAELYFGGMLRRIHVTDAGRKQNVPVQLDLSQRRLMIERRLKAPLILL